jgi:hypothetical protein
MFNASTTRLVLGNAGLVTAPVAKRSNSGRPALRYVDCECYRLCA